MSDREDTLVSIALEWHEGKVSLDDALAAVRTLPRPVRHEADDGAWFEGNSDNLISSLQARVGEDFPMERYHEFVSAIVAGR